MTKKRLVCTLEDYKTNFEGLDRFNLHELFWVLEDLTAIVVQKVNEKKIVISHQEAESIKEDLIKTIKNTGYLGEE